METWKLGNHGNSESRNHWRLGGLDCETWNLGSLEALKWNPDRRWLELASVTF